MSLSFDNVATKHKKLAKNKGHKQADTNNRDQIYLHSSASIASSDRSISETAITSSVIETANDTATLLKVKKPKKKKSQNSKSVEGSTNNEINGLTNHLLDDSSIISDLSNNDNRIKKTKKKKTIEKHHVNFTDTTSVVSFDPSTVPNAISSDKSNCIQESTLKPKKSRKSELDNSDSKVSTQPQHLDDSSQISDVTCETIGGTSERKSKVFTNDAKHQEVSRNIKVDNSSSGDTNGEINNATLNTIKEKKKKKKKAVAQNNSATTSDLRVEQLDQLSVLSDSNALINVNHFIKSKKKKKVKVKDSNDENSLESDTASITADKSQLIIHDNTANNTAPVTQNHFSIPSAAINEAKQLKGLQPELQLVGYIQERMNKFHMCSSSTPHCVTTNNKLFFQTKADAERYSAYLKKMLIRIMKLFNQHRLRVLNNSIRLWKTILVDFKESDLKSMWHIDNSKIHEMECNQSLTNNMERLQVDGLVLNEQHVVTTLPSLASDDNIIQHLVRKEFHLTRDSLPTLSSDFPTKSQMIELYQEIDMRLYRIKHQIIPVRIPSSIEPLISENEMPSFIQLQAATEPVKTSISVAKNMIKNDFRAVRKDVGISVEGPTDFSCWLIPHRVSLGPAPASPVCLLPDEHGHLRVMNGVSTASKGYSNNTGPSQKHIAIESDSLAAAAAAAAAADSMDKVINTLLDQGINTFVSLMELEEELQLENRSKSSSAPSIVFADPADLPSTESETEKRIKICHFKAKTLREKAVNHLKSQITAAETVINNSFIASAVNIRETGRLTRLRITLEQKQFQLNKLGQQVHFVRIPIARHSCISVNELISYLHWLIERMQLCNESLYIYSQYGHGRVGTIGACLLGSMYGLSPTDSLHMTQLAMNYTVVERLLPIKTICPALPLHRQTVKEVLSIMNQKFICPEVNWSSSADSGISYNKSRSTAVRDVVGVGGSKISLNTSGMYDTPFTNERQATVRNTLATVPDVAPGNTYMLPSSLGSGETSSQLGYRQQHRSYDTSMYKPSYSEFHSVSTRPHAAKETIDKNHNHPYTNAMEIKFDKRAESANPFVNRLAINRTANNIGLSDKTSNDVHVKQEQQHK